MRGSFGRGVRCCLGFWGRWLFVRGKRFAGLEVEMDIFYIDFLVYGFWFLV